MLHAGGGRCGACRLTRKVARRLTQEHHHRPGASFVCESSYSTCKVKKVKYIVLRGQNVNVGA